MKSTTSNSAILLASSLTTLLLGAPCTTHASTKHTAPMKQPLPPRRKMPYLRNSDIEELINTASKNDPKHTLTSDTTNWMSVNENVEFLPLLNNKSVVQRRMEDVDQQQGDDDAYTASTGTTTGAHDNSDPYSHQPFIEGLGNYPEMAQAWRMLGLMIDCQHKAVEDDDYHQSGSGDQGTDDGCSRWILWAAYVDLDYSGGGVNEYQYYDKDSGKWDKSHCTGDRCAKMDCHLENTHFSVLGFFK